MLVRSLVSTFIVASSFVLVAGQTPGAKKEDGDKTAYASLTLRHEAHAHIPDYLRADWNAGILPACEFLVEP